MPTAPQRHTSVTCKRLMSSTSTLKGCTFDTPKKGAGEISLTVPFVLTFHPHLTNGTDCTVHDQLSVLCVAIYSFCMYLLIMLIKKRSSFTQICEQDRRFVDTSE